MEQQSVATVLKNFITSTFGKSNLWENARFLTAEIPLDKENTQKILPIGMRLSNPPRGFLFIVDYKEPSFTVPYKEAALIIHVKTPFGKGIHCPWMVVDDDTAMAFGRELLGYPKKMADISFEEDGKNIRARVSRRGISVLEMSGVCNADIESPPPVLDLKTFNVGGLGQFFFSNPIWFFRPKEHIHSSREAAVNVSMEESEFDPIARYISGNPISGRFSVLDIQGTKYYLPVGMTGPIFFGRTFFMRFK